MTNARLFYDARPRLHLIVEDVTLDVGGSTESVFTIWTCKYEVKRRLQKKGVITQRVYKVKPQCQTILNSEKMRWSLHQAWPFQRYHVKSGTRIAEQASICVYKACTFI